MRALWCLALSVGCASAPVGPVGVPHASGQRQSPEALQADCDHGNARACNNLGADYATGHDTAMNPSLAAQLFAKACDAGDLNGCYNLGLATAEGRGRDRDEARAVDLFARACEGGIAHACTSPATSSSPRW